MTDLISKKTRTEFREYFVGTTLRTISEEFDAADVPFSSDYIPPESGQRRSLVEQYYHAVDFSSWRDVQKVLRVFENVLIELEERIKHPPWGNKDEWAEKRLSLLLRRLERDGFVYVSGRLTAAAYNPTVEELSETASGLDSTILRQQIDRIRNAIEDDPDLAIGTAKELVETTCRTILADYGISADAAWDVTRLVKEARAVLKLVPEDVPDSAKSVLSEELDQTDARLLVAICGQGRRAWHNDLSGKPVGTLSRYPGEPGGNGQAPPPSRILRQWPCFGVFQYPLR